ncbi:uncharacterized protein LOC122264405 [Penaeus japonicus]|uniref:uncharacterized protein LOC122264405 n=1 Tax=Penaeus japonicus TaxID=27405 RepID=UPI001C70F1D9|nr:uncharacterized protein LOC122264405 [Penaeus japonicus]
MEQQYQEKRRGSTTCLVCGRQGGNTVVVTSVHSFVSASGTPLSDFLVKVVGEDPCYSVSEVICQQCFVLLDRLDAYQARAAEIHTHVTSRYRDTKLELLGQRQRMSELIASSLSNVQELRHGTTLNAKPVRISCTCFRDSEYITLKPISETSAPDEPALKADRACI